MSQRFLTLLLGPAALLAAGVAQAQAPTPQDHPGARLADAIAAAGCVIHQDTTNELLFSAEIQPPEYPPMAIALIEDGILSSTGNGSLTLLNWGLCVGDRPVLDAEAETEAGAEEADADGAEDAGTEAGDEIPTDSLRCRRGRVLSRWAHDLVRSI